jgi:hypothetical protein
LTLPIAKYLGVPKENVYANRMNWQWDDETGALTAAAAAAAASSIVLVLNAAHTGSGACRQLADWSCMRTMHMQWTPAAWWALT